MTTQAPTKTYSVAVWHGEADSIAYVMETAAGEDTAEIVASYTRRRHGPRFRETAEGCAERLQDNR